MKSFLFIILFYSLNSFAAWQAPARLVARQLEKKLFISERALAQNEAAPLVMRTHGDEAYYLKRIRLQFAPFVAFDVSAFELKIKPLFELRWTRNNPKGWMNYKPLPDRAN